MKNDVLNELNELAHWLAYNYPGVYRAWSDYKENQIVLNNLTKGKK